MAVWHVYWTGNSESVKIKRKMQFVTKTLIIDLQRRQRGNTPYLLENPDNNLPIRNKGTIAIVGAFAKHPPYRVGDSAHLCRARFYLNGGLVVLMMVMPLHSIIMFGASPEKRNRLRIA